MIIESRSNERVKEARKLLLRKERKESGLHLIESEKLVREAIASGAEIVSCFLEGRRSVSPAGRCNSLFRHPRGAGIALRKPDAAGHRRRGQNARSHPRRRRIQADSSSYWTACRIPATSAQSCVQRMRLARQGCCFPQPVRCLRAKDAPCRDGLNVSSARLAGRTVARARIVATAGLYGPLRRPEGQRNPTPAPRERRARHRAAKAAAFPPKFLARCEGYRLPMFGRAESPQRLRGRWRAAVCRLRGNAALKHNTKTQNKGVIPMEQSTKKEGARRRRYAERLCLRRARQCGSTGDCGTGRQTHSRFRWFDSLHVRHTHRGLPQHEEAQKLPVPHCIAGTDGWAPNSAV